jgi:hypothetical protein
MTLSGHTVGEKRIEDVSLAGLNRKHLTGDLRCIVCPAILRDIVWALHSSNTGVISRPALSEACDGSKPLIDEKITDFLPYQ